jgi:hypothetical protein
MNYPTERWGFSGGWYGHGSETASINYFHMRNGGVREEVQPLQYVLPVLNKPNCTYKNFRVHNMDTKNFQRIFHLCDSY